MVPHEFTRKMLQLSFPIQYINKPMVSAIYTQIYPLYTIALTTVQSTPAKSIQHAEQETSGSESIS